MRLLHGVVLVFLVLSFSACAIQRAAPTEGGVLTLEWSAIPVPADAENVRYECAVHVAEQGLPRRRVLLRTVRDETRLVSPLMPAGEYVFAVRARYRRGGQDWATRWRGRSQSSVALVPQRGFRRVVPEKK